MPESPNAGKSGVDEVLVGQIANTLSERVEKRPELLEGHVWEDVLSDSPKSMVMLALTCDALRVLDLGMFADKQVSHAEREFSAPIFGAAARADAG